MEKQKEHNDDESPPSSSSTAPDDSEYVSSKPPARTPQKLAVETPPGKVAAASLTPRRLFTPSSPKSVSPHATTYDDAPDPKRPVRRQELRDRDLPEAITDFTVDHDSQSVTLQSGAQLVVPQGALPKGCTLPATMGHILFGPFALPEGYQLGSAAVFIDLDNTKFQKPLELTIPHWYGGTFADHTKDGLTFIKAPHQPAPDGRYHFSAIEGGDFTTSSDAGSISIQKHMCILCIAFQAGSKTAFYAKMFDRKGEGQSSGHTYNIVICYAVPAWLEVLKNYYVDQKRYCESSHKLERFQITDKYIEMDVEDESGNGWWLTCDGSNKINESEFVLDRFTDKDDLKTEINYGIYPPSFEYHVTYSNTPSAVDQQRRRPVCLTLHGSNKGKITFRVEVLETLTARDEPALDVSMAAKVAVSSNNSIVVQDNRLEERPTNKECLKLIGPEMEAHWKQLGTSLGLAEDGVLDAIDLDNGSSTEKCMDVIKKWLEGRGTVKCTWSGILEVIAVHCQRRELADRIQQKLLAEP